MFKGPRYTETELMARLKFTVGLSLAFTLTGIVFVVLYSQKHQKLKKFDQKICFQHL